MDSHKTNTTSTQRGGETDNILVLLVLPTFACPHHGRGGGGGDLSTDHHSGKSKYVEEVVGIIVVEQFDDSEKALALWRRDENSHIIAKIIKWCPTNRIRTYAYMIDSEREEKGNVKEREQA